MHGSRTLIRWLLDNDLVDEITLLTFPVVVGQGTRLLPDTGPPSRLNDRSSNGTDTLNRHTSCYRHVADEMTCGRCTARISARCCGPATRLARVRRYLGRVGR
jgi:hypothetical protein